MGASSGAGGHHYSQTEIRALSRRRGRGWGAPGRAWLPGSAPPGTAPKTQAPIGQRDRGAGPNAQRGGARVARRQPGRRQGGGETPEGKRRGRTWVFRASL